MMLNHGEIGEKYASSYNTIKSYYTIPETFWSSVRIIWMIFVTELIEKCLLLSQL